MPLDQSERIDPSTLFSLDDPFVTRDVLAMVLDFLTGRGYAMQAAVLRDEARLPSVPSNASWPPTASSSSNASTAPAVMPPHDSFTTSLSMRMNPDGNQISGITTSNAMQLMSKEQRDLAVLRESCLEGDWDALRELAKRAPHGKRKAFTYAVLKQEFLELVEQQEPQMAFAFFNRRLKPMEASIKQLAGEHEFVDLLFSTTCKSPRERFRDWEGVSEAREKLLRDLTSMIDVPQRSSSTASAATIPLGFSNNSSSSVYLSGLQSTNLHAASSFTSLPQPLNSQQSLEGIGGEFPTPDPNRLLHLIQQAYAWQIESSKAPRFATSPRVTSLLSDIVCVAVPDTQVPTVFVGHAQSVKCLTYVGQTGKLVASGSNDSTFALWSTTPMEGSPLLFRADVGARIWDVASTQDGSLLSLACSDSTVSIWSVDHAALDDSLGTLMRRQSSTLLRGSVLSPSSTPATAGSLVNKEPFKEGESSPGGGYGDREEGEDEIVRRHSSEDGVSAGGNGFDFDEPIDLTGNTPPISSSFSPLRKRSSAATLGGSSPATRSSICRRISVLETGHDGDVYSVKFHPDQHSLVSAGWDRTVRLVDLETGQCIKVFRGHEASVTQANFSPLGNLVVTGSKDSTVRFFDPSSGICVKTFAQLLGEVSSVEMSRDGRKLLTSCKDSTIRVWDVRNGQALARCKGHQNSAKNFIRASFGSRDSVVLSGSQDGSVFAWDADSGKSLQRLRGHRGAVFRAIWCEARGELATCAEDGTVRRWVNGPQVHFPLFQN